jgi:phage N-6-adenine-methyltransferase
MTKGNDGTGNTAERDEWQTPQELFNKLNSQYEFFLDCCANSNNSKCPKFCINFLECGLKWQGPKLTCWINPPFSKAYVMLEHFFKVVKKGVGIYRSDNLETKLWQEVILSNCDWVFFPNKRIAYEGMDGKGCRFPSALFGIGIEPPRNIQGKLVRVQGVNND